MAVVADTDRPRVGHLRESLDQGEVLGAGWPEHLQIEPMAAATDVAVAKAVAGQAAGALSTGVRLYALYNDLRDGSIRQRGRGNSAGLAQRGRGNLGLVEQRGDGHSGTLEQNGDRNTYGLFQYGRGTDDHIVQNGDNGTGTTFSYGW